MQHFSYQPQLTIKEVKDSSVSYNDRKYIVSQICSPRIALHRLKYINTGITQEDYKNASH